MAHIDDGGGDNRSASVDLNLVPFIDLMSVCIIFLLITAVWTQVSMIQLGSSIYGQKTQDEESKPPPRAEIPFRVDVMENGYRIVVGREKTSIPRIGSEYDLPQLRDKLRKVKELYPEKVDAVITVQDELAYRHLIDGMDALLGAEFPEISVATGGAQ